MVKCSNCRCDIEESKMILHERFCFQNIKYCDICQEGIIKEEFEEHCENHKKSKEIKNLDSEEERNNRSLQRVNSSKIGCQYCELFLTYDELEEHEEMCGARSTQCKFCGKTVIYKDLENHLITKHNTNKSSYKEFDSGLFNNNNYVNKNSYQQNINTKGNLTQQDLKRMTSEEQIQYAIAMSTQQNNSNFGNNSNIKKEDLLKKSSSGLDMDEIEYEYQRQLYEDEMKDFE